ncbi:MAG: sulfatase [Candidatus Bipolaricaulia bacterium]
MTKGNKRWNIIVITVDSLRADAIGGSEGRDQSPPYLEQFTQQGIVFSQAIAQGPYTTASIPSLLTGLFPSRLELIPFPEITGVLPGNELTLASWLKKAGYHTAAFHSSPLLSRIFGYARGFDAFYDDLLGQNLRLPPKAKLALNRLQRAFRAQPYLPAKTLNHKALAWLEGVKEPFFLWLHYMDTHGPYQHKKGLRYLEKVRAERLWRKAAKEGRPKTGLLTGAEVEELRAAYREEVAYLDRQLEILFERLDRMGLLQSSLIVFTSDHGDAFGEHGFFVHPHYPYEELIRVPLIIRTPGIEPKIIDKPVPLVSLTPTVLDFTGTSVDTAFDGQSLRPLLETGDDSCLPEYIISEAEFDPYYIGAIRTVEWKLILNEEAGTKELYHLIEDPNERQNVVQDYPNIAEELETKLRDRRHPTQKSEEIRELLKADHEILDKRLQDLGYL